MPRVLISDEVSARAIECLRRAGGIEVDYRPTLSAAGLRDALAGCAALVVRSRTKVTAGVLEAADGLLVIGRAGTGVDNVDVEAATRRGVVVMNVPGGNTISAAEHTLAMLLAVARGIPAADRSVRSGRWERGRFVGAELEGKVLGVVGLGRIGREVAARARAFGMEVIAHDPFVSAEEAERSPATFLPLPDLLRRADFVTLHTPLTSETRHMIGAEELALMRPEARLVNCARGGIVDEAALARALEAGRLAAAALDVFEQEPPADLPFRGMEQVVLTPHLAASTAEAQEKVAVSIAEQVRDYLLEGVPRNAVNAPAVDPKVRETAAPFLDLAESLGRFQAQVAEGRLREVAVECGGEVPEGARASVTVAVLKGYFERFLTGPVNAVNAAWIARERGVRLREIQATEPHDYRNLIATVFESDAGRRTIAGTVFGRNLPRVVTLDGFRFDVRPEGELLLVSNDDRPGIVGMVGTLLGEHQINIAHMSLGRDRAGGQAIAVLQIDTPLPGDLAAELRSRPGITWVRAVSLGRRAGPPAAPDEASAGGP
ncbi:MAG TPA: phosphoglycerate dehydrogenase [Candidatus Polarisedimenticolia bacterium]|nr:phosphoglycerate dehydrogenase [Candidatus Polarisedimenticolia bacterium]